MKRIALLAALFITSSLHGAGRHALILCNQRYMAIASPTPYQALQSDGKSESSSSTIAPALILKLQSSDGEFFQIRQINPIKRSVFVTLGGAFGFERGNVRFKITSSSTRVVNHPTLGAIDIYVVKILDSVSGKEFELVQGIETAVPPVR